MNTRTIGNGALLETRSEPARACDPVSLPASVPRVWRERLHLWRWIRVAMAISSGFALLVALLVAVAGEGSVMGGGGQGFADRVVAAAGWFVMTWGFTLLVLLPVVRLLQRADSGFHQRRGLG